MRKFLSVNLVGLFVLSGAYASTDEYNLGIYTPRTPANHAQLSDAIDATKSSLHGAKSATFHPNTLFERDTFGKESKTSNASHEIPLSTLVTSAIGKKRGNTWKPRTIQLPPEVSFFG